MDVREWRKVEIESYAQNAATPAAVALGEVRTRIVCKRGQRLTPVTRKRITLAMNGSSGTRRGP